MFNRSKRQRQSSPTLGAGLELPSPGSDGHAPGITAPGFMDGTFSQASFTSAVKEFTHPGKEPAELLMRCVFKDIRELNAAVMFMARCTKFKDGRHKQMLLHRLAGSTSLQGERAKMLLQAVVGQLASNMLNKQLKVKSEQ